MSTSRQRVLPAVHPGEVLREEFLLPHEIDPTSLARELCLAGACIQDIVDEQSGITDSLAGKLAAYFGTSAEFWLALQRNFESRSRLTT